jgi:site-specific recombinase XerD
VAHEFDSGRSSATATHRLVAPRLFSGWCHGVERAIPRDDLVGLKAPKLDQKVVDELTRDEMTALVRACEGRRFTDVRATWPWCGSPSAAA